MEKGDAIHNIDDRSTNRLQAFLDQFGRGPAYWLACHAAFPLVLTPALLYKIWGNFRMDEKGRPIGAPLISVADILHSTLCRKVGRQAYEIPENLRQYLLHELKKNEDFQAARIQRLAAFTHYYVQEYPHELPFVALREAQNWVTTAYLDPNAAARLILETMDKQGTDTSCKVKLELLLAVTEQSEKVYEEQSEGAASLLQVARQIANSNRVYEQGQNEEALQHLMQVGHMLSDTEVAGAYRTKVPEEVFERFCREMEARRMEERKEKATENARLGHEGIPILYFAFANSPQSPLPGLKEEDERIYNILAQRSLQQHFRIQMDSYITIEALAGHLIRLKNDLTLLHFAGHSGTAFLFSKELNLTWESGISRLLGQCPQLKLVVLNSSTTSSQVESLLEAGIPAVIAASNIVEDNKAVEFAERFYDTLANGFTLSEAFRQSQEMIKAKYGNLPETITSSGRGFARKETGEGLWGLYCNDERILDWRLIDRDGRRESNPKVFTPNDFLFDVLFERLVMYKEARVIDPMELESNHTKRMIVINALPAPLGEDLRKLVARVDEGEGYDKVGMARLQQLVRTFETGISILTFSMLSILWDASGEMHIDKINAKQLDPIKRIFDAEALRIELGNVALQVIQAVYVVFQENNVLPKFGEFFEIAKQLSYEAAPLLQAAQFLSFLSVRVKQGNINDDEAVELCIDSEKKLTHFLGELAFLASYTMVTVLDLKVVKLRNKSPVFRHKLLALKDLLGGGEYSEYASSNLFDTHSILLLKKSSLDANGEFLNLSPFIIDENAYLKAPGMSPRICFFQGFSRDRRTYFYQYINRPPGAPLLSVSQYEMPHIFSNLISLFEAFAVQIFGQKIQEEL